MEFIQKMQEEKVLPALIVTLLFMVTSLWILRFIEMPAVVEKVEPDKFIPIEIIKEKPKEEEKKEEKEEEKEKPTETQEEILVVEKESEEEVQESEEPLKEEYTEEPVDQEKVDQEKIAESEEETEETEKPEMDALLDDEASDSHFAGTDVGGDEPSDLPDYTSPGSRRRGGRGGGGGYHRPRPVRPSQPSNDTQSDHGRRDYGNIGDIIEPVFQWMEQHPFEFSRFLKLYMKYSPGDLMSRVTFEYQGRRLVMYLLGKRGIRTLGICIVEGNKFTLVVDAGVQREAGYFVKGNILMAGDQVAAFDGEQTKPLREAEELYDIFWDWFDKKVMGR